MSLLWNDSYCCRQQGLKAFGSCLKSCKLSVRVEHLGTNKYIPLVSCVSNLFTSLHCLLKSQSIVHGYLLSTYTAVESEFSQLWGMESGWCRLCCQPFSQHNYWSCGKGVKKLFRSCCSRRLFGPVTQTSLVRVLTNSSLCL